MAMLPFCGYNLGTYFRHWLNMGHMLRRPPKIFSVNWFRVDSQGRFIWPGFGENMRVLKWIVDRVHSRVDAKETPAGLVPKISDLDTFGLDIEREKLASLFDVRIKDWTPEVEDIGNSLQRYRSHLPYEIWSQFQKLEKAASGR